MKNIIIITSNDIRHHYFKIVFSSNSGINVIKTFVESEGKSKLDLYNMDAHNLDDLDTLHFNARHNTEHDFFSDILDGIKDNSNSKLIRKGEINDRKVVDEIISLNADLIITYGCSIIKTRLIESYKNKIINVHLGLSPYYYGAGTNYHALVNSDFQCVGYTFMYMDSGIDTGEIIHQARARILPFDNPHQIGNRLIKDMTKDFVRLILSFDMIKKKTPLSSEVGKTYKKSDANRASNIRLYENFKDGIVFDYLKKQDIKEEKYPIISQEFMK